MAKKITAPHSYAPGKGRPKEYLAYLNEREMAYLRSINGNNMERGPRGLPSFPPKDAIGSSSNAPSKSPASSGVGRDSSRGIGQGAGGSAIGRGPSGPSGGLGGGGKSAPGSSPSSPGGLRGAGGNYGPGSGKPGTTSSPGGYKGPSSPMGGQGPSYSNDTKAQQEAQVRDAIKAVKNTPAFRNDASSGGIRTLSVGPIGTPVNVGPRVTPTQNRTSGPNNYNNIVTGGGGVMAYGGPMPKAPTRASPTTTPQKQFYERIAPGASPSTSISSQFPSYKYDAPLTPGVSPEDMARRSALMNQYEREARTIANRSPDPFSTGNPNMAGNPPAGQSRKENPLAGTGYGAFNIAGVDRMMAAPEDLPPEELRSAAGTYTSPYDAPPVREMKDMTVEEMIRALRPPGKKEDGPFPDATFRRKAAETYTSPYDAPPRELRSAAGTYTSPYDTPQKELRSAAGTYTSPYDAPSTAKNSKLFDDRLITNNGITKEATSEQINQMTPEDQKKLADSLQTPTYTPPNFARGPEGEYSFSNEGSVVDGTDFQNEGTAPSQDPGTPAPGENPALGPAYPEDNFIEKGLKKAGIWGKLYAGADWAAKKNFDKMTLAEQREEMARWQQLKENTRRNVQGKNNRVGGSTSTTSPGGGITDIGSGGKNEPPRIEQAEKEATKPKPKPKEDGPRPAIYYKWDLGVDVPSPTDSDYTLYLKYLQEKAAAKAGMAR